MYKAYICLFTCATSRALHLELTPSLETITFTRAMKQFFVRRGFPCMLLSDNAKTFECNDLKLFLRINRIESDFILPFTNVSSEQLNQL